MGNGLAGTRRVEAACPHPTCWMDPSTYPTTHPPLHPPKPPTIPLPQPGVWADGLADDALAPKSRPAWIHANHRIGFANKTALLRLFGLWDDGAQFEGECR